ncbi:MAG: hypothetical protein ABI920_19445 [Casimicrobiaceae bacterium]
MPITRLALATALAGLAVTAHAQRIEISSPSLGTVVVTPAPISGSAASGRQVAGAPRAGNGVDLGLRRNPDGSLYDSLDPRQHPAATTTASPRNRTAGVGVAQFAASDVDRRDAAGGIAPSGRYGYASPESAGATVEIVNVPTGNVPGSVPRARGAAAGNTAVTPRGAGNRATAR